MSPRGRLLLSALTGLLLGSPSLGANGVQGYVLDPVAGEQVAGVEVAFFTQQEGQLSEILRKTTDPQGRFAFSGPFVQEGLEFVLAAFYRGVPHFTTTLQVGAQQEVIVEVYEPTDDDTALRIATHNLFLALASDELNVAHLVQLDNAGERTYIGREEGGQRLVAAFALPPGVFGLQSHAGQIVAAENGLFYDTQPLPPGLTQITFTFTLEAPQLDQGYLHAVRYPTARLEVFLQPSDFQPGVPFEDLGIADLHGNQYRRLRLSDLQPGQQVLIPLPLTRSWRWALKWGALGGGLLGGFIALLLGSRSGRGASPSAALPDPRILRLHRDDLVERLARLDEAHADRQTDPHYRAERARLIDQARVVFRLLEEQDGDR